MTLEFDDIRQKVQGADASTSATREEAGDMLVFGRISQWDDDIAQSVLTEFRGQFDLIKPKRNRILSELWANPVSVDFKPIDGADHDTAEMIGGAFRTDMIASEEALETAQMDQVDCGFGAFRFVTEYENKAMTTDNYQRIKAEPINEANNVLYIDDNAKRKDKSDASWALLITAFTKDGWKSYCKETGIDYEENKTPGSFKSPNKTNIWFWRSDTNTYKIGEFYHREKKRSKLAIFEDPIGEQKAVKVKDLKKIQDELDDFGFVKVGERYIEHYEVTKYILTGEKIVKTQRIAGEYIPIIPVYGDHSYVEQREMWRGIYHDAQDSQRLHNFQMSYLADIVAKGPREKPIFTPEQIQGKEIYWHENGSDDNYAYKLINSVDAQGNPLPPGPINYTQNPTVPPATAAILEYTRQSVDDVTGGGTSMDAMMNSQVTEGQIQAAQSASNQETFLYRNNFQLAMKHAGRVYASMFKEIYDVPREVTITKADGTEQTVMSQESVVDLETGEEIVLRDPSQGAFEVFADTGPAYSTQREQVRAEMNQLATSLQGTPVGEMALYYYLMMLDGPMTEGIRTWAKEQLMMMGQIEPETEEEKEKIAQIMQAQQSQAQQPDPNMLLAMAEQGKAEADMAKVQTDAQIKSADLAIKQYNAETQRLKVMGDNQFNALEAEKLSTEITGNELDNVSKIAQAFMPRTVQ